MPASAEAQVRPLRATHIVVGRNVVSFYAPDSLYWMRKPIPRVAGVPQVRVAMFDRERHRWLDGDDHVVGSPIRLPDKRHPSVPVAPGWAMVGDQRQRGPDWFPAFALHDARTGHRYLIRPTLSTAERWRAALQRDSLTGREYVLWWDDPPTTTTYISSMTSSPDAFWFVCGSAGSGLSSIVRFDRATHRMTTLSGGAIASMAIAAVAQTHRALWIAGHADVGSGLTNSGVYRFDLATLRWTRFAPDTTRWPAGQVTALAAVGDSLWVATESGVAVHNDAGGADDARWFAVHLVARESRDRFDRQYLVIDDAYTLNPHPPTRSEARERLRIALAGRLSGTVEEDSAFGRDSLIALIRGIPDAHLDSALSHPGDPFQYALTWPTIVSRGTQGWLDRDSSLGVFYDGDLVLAAADLNDRRYLGLLNRVLARGQLGYWNVHLVESIARLGDSAGLGWLREQVSKQEDLNEIETAVLALGRLHDTLAAPLVTARLEPGSDSSSSGFLLAEVANVATPGQWHDVITRPGADAWLRAALLNRMYTINTRGLDSLVDHDSLTRELALQTARHELARSTETMKAADRFSNRWVGAELLLRLQDREAPRYLIPLLTRSPGDYRLANSTLVELTGVDSAPVVLHPIGKQRADGQRFWATWWEERQRAFTPVGEAAGKAALLRWRVRALGIHVPS
jgi:hypothetical protein